MTEIDDLNELLRHHPADIADHLQRLSAEDARELFRQLPAEIAARVLAETDRERADELVVDLDRARVIELFRHLPAEQVTDLAAALPADQLRQVLQALPRELSESVTALLRYPEDTAGGIMSDRYIALNPELTMAQASERLRSMGSARGIDISYLYVTNDRNQLIGVAPLRDIVFGGRDERIGDVMNRDVKFLRVDADQEEITRQFGHYHYLGLPVVDALDRLVGVIKLSDVLGVAQAEATEDMQLMVGLSGEERILTPWPRSVGRRLPWLGVNFITALGAASVIWYFEDTIARWTALAMFLPIIAGMGGNAGMQTLTVVIRDMALGELKRGDGRRALLKEVWVGLVNGLAIGAVVGVAGYLWKGDVTLGLLAGAAMWLNLVAAALAGVLIPLGLKTCRIDPALASSIFVTTVTDVAGFFFFLGLAASVLRWGSVFS